MAEVDVGVAEVVVVNEGKTLLKFIDGCKTLLAVVGDDEGNTFRFALILCILITLKILIKHFHYVVNFQGCCI